MSHRRDVIAKMAEAMSWTLSIDAEEAAADALDALLGSDFVSLVREGVESGTIKGQVVGWCTSHGQRANTLIEKPGCFQRLGCHVESRLVIPVSDGGSET